MLPSSTLATPFHHWSLPELLGTGEGYSFLVLLMLFCVIAKKFTGSDFSGINRNY